MSHVHLEGEVGGYEAADIASPAVSDAYEQVAQLIGTTSRNIAIVENATVAFSQALAAFDFEKGDRIVTTRNDYVANQLAFLALASRLGVDVVHAVESPEGGVDVEDFRRKVDAQRCRVATISWMPTNSGLVQDVIAISAVCRDAGVPLIVDACQAVGQVAINAPILGCEFMTATARKFLRGPRGVGFLYVSEEALARGLYPITIDSRGAQWTGAAEFELRPSAKRFENWEFAYALVLGLGEAARYAQKQDVNATGARARTLGAYARSRFQRLPGVSVLDRGRELSAIVSLRLQGHDARAVVGKLRQRNINTSAALREWALLDMDDKQAETALRVSPHYYNTENEIDLVVDALEEIMREELAPRGTTVID
jgi:selenocysteine lyase/cysteine desulfurase